MKTRFLALLSAGALSVLTDQAYAHGSIYRGPGDTVPPSPGSGRPGGPAGPAGPTTGQPGGPTAPAPSGPTMPGPTTGGGPGAGPGRTGPRTGGGIELTDDLSTWDYWWECNKHGYLRLKDAVHRGAVTTGDDGFYLGPKFRREQTLRPTLDQLQNEVLPALRRAIDATEQRDITSSCMIAMAKIGQNHPDFLLVDVFRQRLARHDQEIRETAALSIGIAGRYEHGEIELLQGLALDSSTGRAASNGEVHVRTRAFALYGLGLIAHEHRKLAIKQEVFGTLRTALADEGVAHRDLKVAAIVAMGMLDLGTTDAMELRLRTEAFDCLWSYFERDLGPGDQLIQAHCPTAMAKLVGKRGPEASRLKKRLLAELAKEDKQRRSADLARSCVLALGQLACPHDDANSEDAAISKQLWETRIDHRDDQTRHFAILALGQIGGAANRTWLLDGTRRAKALERPWFALALGVMTHAAIAGNANVDFRDQVVGDRLHELLKDAAEPSFVGALGVALGLCHHLDAASTMQSRMLGALHKEQQAGFLSLGLALMDDRTAIPSLQSVVRDASRRSGLLQQAAVALGLLGEKSAAGTLQQMLTDTQGNLATFAAAASALGLIGDRRSIPPLRDMLFDKDRSDLARAFAAVALGGIADRAPLPWHTNISANLNYRAATETLRNQSTGILDIL